MIKKLAIVTFFVLISVFFLPQINAAVDCLSLTAASPKADRDFCKKELSQIEAQLADLLKKQEKQRKQTGTLKGDVDYLSSQIDALKTKIKARTLKIAQLKVDINGKVSAIENLSEKINNEYESLAQLLRNTNDFDNKDFVYLMFSSESLSGFYSDLESYTSIKQAVKNSVDQIKGIKSETEAEKKDLEEKQDAETDAQVELETAQKKVVQSEAEKKKLLTISKNKEIEYQKLAAEKKARADKIRSALFNLAGISEKIEFGTALEYANEAKAKFGIDPAFLLAILTQESDLGANVGSCYVTDTSTGNGKGANTGSPQIRVMHPTRDIPIFLNIVNKFGLNYTLTRVSCWQPAYNKDGTPFGWGGAMGPAQFIPSTWKLFEIRLKNLLGHDANPWNPKDAFMASAMYLTDLGAVGNGASAQNRAACSYYGSCTRYRYDSSVAKLKASIQANIDLLSS